MSQQKQQPQEIQQTVSALSTIHISTKPLPVESGTQHVTFVLSTNPTQEQRTKLESFQPPPSSHSPSKDYITVPPGLTPTSQSVFRGHINDIIRKRKQDARNNSLMGPGPLPHSPQRIPSPLGHTDRSDDNNVGKDSQLYTKNQYPVLCND